MTDTQHATLRADLIAATDWLPTLLGAAAPIAVVNAAPQADYTSIERLYRVAAIHARQRTTTGHLPGGERVYRSLDRAADALRPVDLLIEIHSSEASRYLQTAVSAAREARRRWNLLHLAADRVALLDALLGDWRSLLDDTCGNCHAGPGEPCHDTCTA